VALAAPFFTGASAVNDGISAEHITKQMRWTASRKAVIRSTRE